MKIIHLFRTPQLNKCLAALLLLAIGQWACVKKEAQTVAVPVITSVNKALVHVGDTLIISGSGFNSKPADNLVSLATSALTVSSASSTQLAAVVPAGAQSGQLTVSFPGGKTATYDSVIQVIGATQPYITSITPATAYAGDTIIIRGGNFASPASSNDVLVGSVVCPIYNSNDSVIQAIIPITASTGQMTVTTNGSTSPPVSFIITKFNPLSDGRLYWVDDFEQFFSSAPMQIYRGTDSAFNYPYGTVVYTGAVDLPTTSNSLSDGSGLEPFPSDPQGNAYYLNDVTEMVQIIRLTPAHGGGPMTHTVIYSNDFTNASSIIFGSNPDYAFPVLTAPGLLSIDGNTLYTHLGISNTYLAADLTAPTPTFNAVTGLVPDSSSIGMQFGTNYIFYQALGSDMNGEAIFSAKYVKRGSATAMTIPIPANEELMTMLADNSHGDNTLIITTLPGDLTYMKIYRFNAQTQTLQLLYGPGNWSYSLQPSYGSYETGFLWAGSHIYFNDIRNNLYPYGGAYYTEMFVLNDDGSSTRTLNVYPRLENTGTNSMASAFTHLFIEKQ